ncbi:hypothetical protein PG994_000030 [Apiospora phragmitis]|uniref:Uncharacterized protein n=1 Tax=Apiospora phragmitis TaxID=2905665 RepID=A0ABR1X518_9PEZI
MNGLNAWNDLIKEFNWAKANSPPSNRSTAAILQCASRIIEEPDVPAVNPTQIWGWATEALRVFHPTPVIPFVTAEDVLRKPGVGSYIKSKVHKRLERTLGRLRKESGGLKQDNPRELLSPVANQSPPSFTYESTGQAADVLAILLQKTQRLDSNSVDVYLAESTGNISKVESLLPPSSNTRFNILSPYAGQDMTKNVRHIWEKQKSLRAGQNDRHLTVFILTDRLLEPPSDDDEDWRYLCAASQHSIRELITGTVEGIYCTLNVQVRYGNKEKGWSELDGRTSAALYKLSALREPKKGKKTSDRRHEL